MMMLSGDISIYLSTAAWDGGGIHEVPLVDEDDDEEEANIITSVQPPTRLPHHHDHPAAAQEEEEQIGVTISKKAKAGGLGKLKDYSSRKKDMPNPYAPSQVGIDAERGHSDDDD